MGVYNVPERKILAKAIDSILNQTYQDFEFIICDDGSTDSCYEILQEYAQKDKRIKLLKNEKNKGLSYTLNKCLSFAQGEYIARMDADDVALPTRLEQELKFLSKNKDYAMVGSNVYFIDGDKRWGVRSLPERPNKKDFLFTSPFVHPSIMIRRDVLCELNGYAEDAIRCEDYDLWMRLYAQGYKGYNIQEYLLEFREDKNAYHRRAYRYRWYEGKIRLRGFRKLGLLPIGIPYVLKPFIVGLLPQSFLAIMRGNRVAKKDNIL